MYGLIICMQWACYTHAAMWPDNAIPSSNLQGVSTIVLYCSLRCYYLAFPLYTTDTTEHVVPKSSPYIDMHAEKVLEENQKVQSLLIQEIRNNLPNYNKLHNKVITTSTAQPLFILVRCSHTD